MTTYLWAEMVSTDMDGTDDAELLLIPEEVLNEWLPMVAVLKCSTWGEVRALGLAVHQEVLGIAGYGEFADYIANFAVTGEAPGITPGPDAFERFAAQQDAEIPADDQEFDAFSDIPMAADGDWPPSVHLLMPSISPRRCCRPSRPGPAPRSTATTPTSPWPAGERCSPCWRRWGSSIGTTTE